MLETGELFVPGEPVRIFVRKRGRNYDLDDRGRATDLAGKPTGWLPVAQRVVTEEGFNVNRAGVVFVPAFEGRDLALMALRLADTSRAVFAEVLELTDETQFYRRRNRKRNIRTRQRYVCPSRPVPGGGFGMTRYWSRNACGRAAAG